MGPVDVAAAKAPKPKHRGIFKSQASNALVRRFEVSSLWLGISLGFGFWSFRAARTLKRQNPEDSQISAVEFRYVG